MIKPFHRIVIYARADLPIPSYHEWVATNADGSVISFKHKPEFLFEAGAWQAIDGDQPCIVAISSCKSRADAEASLYHYPLENP